MTSPSARSGRSDGSAFSGFLDLVQLADHPGDAPAYRHFKMTPLAAAVYPEGVPPQSEVAQAMARALAAHGLAGTLRDLRACLPADPGRAWNPALEADFVAFVRAAADFERTRPIDACLSQFCPVGRTASGA